MRGELVGELVDGPHSPFSVVTVPAFYAQLRNVPACYHTHRTVPASCAHLPAPSAKPERVFIYNGRYPPLYYAIVGLPSLLGEGSTPLYLMRLLSAALCSVFLALAFTSLTAWSRRRAGLIGLVVALTPMVLFLGGVVNPSALEVAAALCAWSAGAAIVLDHKGAPPTALVVVLGVSAVVFEATRSLSPFWLALTGLALVGVAELDALLALLRRRPVQLVLGAIVAVGALASAWILVEHATNVYSTVSVPYSVPEITILERSFEHNIYYVPDMVGIFGWFDTFSPLFTYVAWYGLVGATLLAGVVAGTRRQVGVLVLFVLAILLVPVAISSSQVHRVGYVWQGRDTLPFAVGLPVLAAAIASARIAGRGAARLVGRAGAAVALVAGLAQYGAFYEALRRYAVGTAGPDFGFLSHASWRPPLGIVFVLVAELVVLALGVVLVARASGAPPPPAPPGPDVPAARAAAGAELAEPGELTGALASPVEPGEPGLA